MACQVATPLLEPRVDFPAWLETQGVNVEVARAMDSELGIRDYGVLRACVGDGLVRAELLAAARDRLPFGFYAVLRQVVKALQGAEHHDVGTPRWDAATSPGDVTLGGLVDVLLALFSGLSRELLVSMQRLAEWDGVKNRTASSAAVSESLEDETTEINHSVQNDSYYLSWRNQMSYEALFQDTFESDKAERSSTPLKNDAKSSLTLNRIKNESFEGERNLSGHSELVIQNVTSLSPSSKSRATTSHAGTCRESQQVAGEMDDDETAGTSGAKRTSQPLTEQCFFFTGDTAKKSVSVYQSEKRSIFSEGESRDFKLKKPDALKMSQPECTGEKSPLSCEVCGRVFSKSSSLKVHLRTHTGEKPHRCDVCGRGFSRASCLKIHQHMHTGEKPFRCEVCGRGFSRSSDLKMHLYTHTGEKPYSCEVCGHGFLQPNVLKIHLRTHTGEKPYSCEVCGHGFSRLNVLKIHQRTHTGEKPYSCKICGRGFSHPNYLKKHLPMHTGEKPHNCEVCGRGFSHLNYLKKHLRTHTGEKPYCCKVCGRSFLHPSYLKSHLRMHTGEKPYSCTICGQRFSQSYHMKSHEQTQHGMDKSQQEMD